jgi:Protein of unknown function (DUF3617)
VEGSDPGYARWFAVSHALWYKQEATCGVRAGSVWPEHSMSTRVLVLLALFAAQAGPAAADVALTPGWYEVQVELSLPNTYNLALRTTVRHCVTAADLVTGRAFFVLSEHPIRACALQDYEAHQETAHYRIACAGPNAASAVAEFELQQTHYRGMIHIRMGGKNMTMVETQYAMRVAACE